MVCMYVGKDRRVTGRLVKGRPTLLGVGGEGDGGHRAGDFSGRAF